MSFELPKGLMKRQSNYFNICQGILLNSSVLQGWTCHGCLTFHHRHQCRRRRLRVHSASSSVGPSPSPRFWWCRRRRRRQCCRSASASGRTGSMCDPLSWTWTQKRKTPQTTVLYFGCPKESKRSKIVRNNTASSAWHFSISIQLSTVNGYLVPEWLD